MGFSRMLCRDHVIQRLLTLKPHLKKHYQISDIGLFGSVARGQNSMGSDLDIVVKMPANLLKRVHLKQELEATLDCEVDVIRYWEGMNPHLKTAIDRDVIYV
ncbi:MAG: nucleotidyltransferase domain-containing protein [Synechocystis sp.]|nr:nucleotidyltransferase domain-containing protein [Synechocystis sp.]